MVAGGVLSWLVLCPAIMYFGEGLAKPLLPATKLMIREMNADQIREFYVLYIGAGAVAAGGIISLFRALPLIVASIRAGLRYIRRPPGARRGCRPSHGSGSIDADRSVGLAAADRGHLGLPGA